MDGEGRFVDEGLCGTGDSPDGGVASGATGDWGAPDGGQPSPRGGYHFVWVPYGMFGGTGTYAPGYVRPGTGGRDAPGTGTHGSVSRGGFGATGAAHAGPASAGT